MEAQQDSLHRRKKMAKIVVYGALIMIVLYMVTVFTVSVLRGMLGEEAEDPFGVETCMER